LSTDFADQGKSADAFPNFAALGTSPSVA